MKKLLAAISLMLSMAAPAFADESPFYAGVSLGPSDIGSSSSTAVGAFVGYKLQNVKLGSTGSLAIEGQYTSLGSFTYSDHFSSLGVDGVALFPIDPVPKLSAFGKLGLNTIIGDYHCGTFCSYSKRSGPQLDFGFGAQYKFTPEFSLRAGYQYYDSNIDTIYAAAIFHF
ncbi:MAG: outer membrane beta-barrel protein [Burkholderiaceae bacterium]